MDLTEIKKTLEEFCNTEYQDYLKSINSNPKEVVVHYLFYMHLKKIKKITSLKMEHPIIYPIREQGILNEDRRVYVDLLVNNIYPIEIKLKKSKSINEIDYPVATIIKNGSTVLKWVGDHRKLCHFTKKHNKGFCINFNSEKAGYVVLEYENGELLA